MSAPDIATLIQDAVSRAVTGALVQREERHLALSRPYSLIASLIPPKIAVFDPAVKKA